MDLLFNSATGLEALLDGNRITVERFELLATNVAIGAGTAVPISSRTLNDNKINLSFGSSGLTNDGFYRFALITNGDEDTLDQVKPSNSIGFAETPIVMPSSMRWIRPLSTRYLVAAVTTWMATWTVMESSTVPTAITRCAAIAEEARRSLKAVAGRLSQLRLR